jgi:N-acetylneuraminate lyase
VQLARHARAHSAAAISSILPPVLYDQRGVAAYYETIAGAVPDLPFFPYLFGGVRDSLALMRELLHIPNLAGTKYTGPNMYELSHIAALRENSWTVFAGMDEQLICALMFGARANIGSTVNLMPGVYRAIHANYFAGDVMRALDLQKRVNRVIDRLLDFGLAGALKAALAFLGFDCGDPRVPNLPLPENRREELRAALQAVGFFDLAAM